MAKENMEAKARMVMAKVRTGAAAIKDGKAVTKAKDPTGSQAGTMERAKASLVQKVKIKGRASMEQKESRLGKAEKEKDTKDMTVHFRAIVEIAGMGAQEGRLL